MDDLTRTIYDGLVFMAEHNRKATARNIAGKLRRKGYAPQVDDHRTRSNQPRRVPRGGGDPYRDPWESQ